MFHLSATGIITDRKDQYEYNLMKCCILPTCLWFILSNESTKAAMYLAVLAPEVQRYPLTTCSPLETAQIKVRVCPDTVLCISLSQSIRYPYPGCIEPCFISGPKGSPLTRYAPWTDSSEFGQALTCTTCQDGWTQHCAHIGKGNIWSAELLPGLH